MTVFPETLLLQKDFLKLLDLFRVELEHGPAIPTNHMVMMGLVRVPLERENLKHRAPASVSKSLTQDLRFTENLQTSVNGGSTNPRKPTRDFLHQILR